MDPEQQQTPEVTPPATEVQDTQLTPEQTEQAEWDKAAEEMFPGLTGKQEESKKDEPPKPDQESEAGKTPPAATAPKKPDAEQGAGDEAAGKGSQGGAEDEGDGDGGQGGEEDGGPDVAGIDARRSARQEAQRVESVKQDVREKLFKDVPTELRDADGDPIRTVEDVMKLINPRTGQQFSEQEAGTFLLAAQSQLSQQLAATDREVARIAEINLDLKDQADMVLHNYGPLLEAMPELGKKVWAQYQKTLVKDEASGIIKEAPIPLEEFYDIALKPYVDLGKKLEADHKAAADKAAADKAAQETQRKQNRQDRSDIYGRTGKTNDLSDDEKEWAEAANAVFGDQLSKRK